ncbi:Fumipyrrole biosynthesis protein C [Frankliniella fusca]|uniref:Fumipyrrole biosynthesis protein C n=1 Tax=Frankliniella fusca TaxID=407009 RepID=A0AAE1HFN3_9NEOP|nr:Fumipyrrole biosynthesis protein C [Frankliniella fusca]
MPVPLMLCLCALMAPCCCISAADAHAVLRYDAGGSGGPLSPRNRISRPAQLSRLLDRDGEEKKRTRRKVSKGLSKPEVFLGGSCNPTTWRQDVAIPLLKNLGITYYNPQVSEWAPELIEKEHYAKQNAAILLFVIDNQTRNTASTVEVAFFSGLRRSVMLVVEPYPSSGCQIAGEAISDDELEDLTAGQQAMQVFAERQDIPVFPNVTLAVNGIAKVLWKNVSVHELHSSRSSPQISDRLMKLREAFDAVDLDRTGEISLKNVRLAFRILNNRNLPLSDLRTAAPLWSPFAGVLEKEAKENVPLENLRVNFDQFCAIVAEFKTNQESEHFLFQNTLVSSGDGDHGLSPEPSYELSKSGVASSRPASVSVEGFLTNSSSESAYCLATGTASDSTCEGLASGSASLSGAGTTWCNSILSYLTSLCKVLGWNPSPVRSMKAVSPGFITNQQLSYDVYLGGSSENTSWRDDAAIPLLKNHGLKYIMPPSSQWTKQMLHSSVDLADRSRVLLFVITNTSRSLAELCMVAYCIGLGFDVVLYIELLTEQSVINGKELTKSAVKDYNRGRMYLRDLAVREGVPLFDSIPAAVEFAATKCLNSSTNH